MTSLEGHGEDGHGEVCEGEADQEVVVDVTEATEEHDGADDEDIVDDGEDDDGEDDEALDDVEGEVEVGQELLAAKRDVCF